MKKLRLLLLLLFFIFSMCLTPVFANSMFQSPQQSKEQARQNFEKRLNLSEKQKTKAKAIHQKGFDEMKPVMDKIFKTKKEIAELKKSDDNSAQEKLTQKRQELSELEKKAQNIRKENSKEFEKILTKKQKAELEKMKAEGRARFEQKHPPKKPFDMFSAPNFWNQKPLFPPPQPPKEKM